MDMIIITVTTDLFSGWEPLTVFHASHYTCKCQIKITVTNTNCIDVHVAYYYSLKVFY